MIPDPHFDILSRAKAKLGGPLVDSLGPLMDCFFSGPQISPLVALKFFRDHQESLDLNSFYVFHRLTLLALNRSEVAGKVDLSSYTTLAEITLKRFLKENKLDRELTVLLMGKLAGYELNFFSDIDLILVSKKPEVSQKLISKCQNFLNQLTLNLGMGKLYNVDLDLRPGGFSSPMVVTPNQLLNHLNNNCESWEYFSYIRSRNLDPRGTLKTKILNSIKEKIKQIGLEKLGSELLKIKNKIELEHTPLEKTPYSLMGSNIKLGPGGIRDLEFSTLFFCLKNAELSLEEISAESTTDLLKKLVQKESIDEEKAENLISCYKNLRRLEHVMQGETFKPIHTLPISYDGNLQFIESLSLTALDLLQQKMAIRSFFRETFNLQEAEKVNYFELWQLGGEKLVEAITKQPFENLGQFLVEASKLKNWYFNGKYNNLANDILVSLLELPERERSFYPLLQMGKKMERFFVSSSYAQIFESSAKSLDTLVKSMYCSPNLSSFLVRYRRDIEDIIMAPVMSRFYDLKKLPYPDEAESDLVIRQLSYLKVLQFFQLSCLLLSGQASSMEINREISKLSRKIIKEVWRVSGAEETELALIGMGKIATDELSFYSDLDCIIIYDPERFPSHEASKIARKFINLLKTTTPAGPLLETDMRLRPSGNKGVLISSYENFFNYQEKEAGVWENLAICRSEMICGDSQQQELFKNWKKNFLPKRPYSLIDRKKCAIQMLKKLEKESPHKLSWKLGPGSLKYLEFIMESSFSDKGYTGNYSLIQMTEYLNLDQKEKFLENLEFLWKFENVTRLIFGRSIEGIESNHKFSYAVSKILGFSSPNELETRLEKCKKYLELLWASELKI